MKTGERRVLVIGSQCRELNPLSFLPAAAEDLYRVLTKPDFGGCVPALPDGVGLLLDPSVAEAKVALRTAFSRASEDGATLLLAYIGHGVSVYDDFYLLPVDGSDTPDSDTGLHLVQFIRELYGRHSFVDGMVVLLDACHAGVAAASAAARWSDLVKWDFRFVLLTATNDETTADGRFTRILVDLVRQGIAYSSSEFLDWEDIRKALLERYPKKQQPPQLSGRNWDKGLFLARNAVWPARRWSAAGTVVASEIERLTAWFQPTPPLAAVVAASQTRRGVRVVGEAGVGKSALAAALIRGEVAEGRVPQGFAQAIAFLTPATSSTELAAQLAAQLDRCLLDFAAARVRFQRDTPESEWQGLDALQREVLGPLRLVGMDSPLRLVFDGLDQLAVGTESAVYAALNALVTDPVLKGIRVVATSRPDTPSPDGFKDVPIGAVADEFIAGYLARRGLSPERVNPVVERVGGNWLIARLLGDLLTADPTADPGALPSDLIGLYERNLKQVGAAARGRWRYEFRPILGALAAAGVGPVLPLPLLCAASGKLGGPSRPARVRDALVDLRGLVIRSAPGTANEHVGVFHQTLVEYLLNPAHAFGSDPEDAHAALADAIAELAPRAEHDWRSPLHRYALAREAEHLWVAGYRNQVVECLEKRSSQIPAVNLQQWQSWAERLRTVFDSYHPDTLSTRRNIAYWTGQSGDIARALCLFQELLPDLQRLLGPDHADTLMTRHNIAFYIGQTDDIATALRLFEQILTDRQRILGPDHPSTLMTRHNIAFYTGQTGDVTTALRLFQEILPDQQRLFGPEHPDTLLTRHNIAYYIGLSSDTTNALRLFQELLPDRQRVLGPDHPSVFMTRNNIAYYTGITGDSAAALRLCQELLLDQQRVLGLDHPYTLLTRSNIARWTWENGDIATALVLAKNVLADMERVLGANHRDSIIVRNRLHGWRESLGQSGDSPQG